MNNDEMRRLFDDLLTEAPPDTTDIDEAMRAGLRARRARSRRVILSVAAVVAVIGVALGGYRLSALRQPTEGRPSATVPSAVVTSDVGTPVTAASDILGSWWTTGLDGKDVRSVQDGRGNPLALVFERRGGRIWWRANDMCNDTSGHFTVDAAGSFRAIAEYATLVGCQPGTMHPRNPAVVPEATEARLVDETATSPRRLLLLATGKVVAQYEFVTHERADGRSATVVVSRDGVTPRTDPTHELVGWLSRSKYGCIGLGGRSAVFPAGTRWSGMLGVLILPDGRTAHLGDVVRGSGWSLTLVEAGQVVLHDGRPRCLGNGPVQVLDDRAQLSVARATMR